MLPLKKMSFRCSGNVRRRQVFRKGNTVSNSLHFNILRDVPHFSRNKSAQSLVLKKKKEACRMAEHVCPWWMGYFLASPLRRLVQKPEIMLKPYVKQGMTVLEIGPGMGFFTLPMTMMVGPDGKVIVSDIQHKMLDNLKKRARKAGVEGRIDCRLSTADTLGIDDVDESVDFALAFAVVHEIPDKKALFTSIFRALKKGRLLYIADPAAHCPRREFDANIAIAQDIGFSAEFSPPPQVRKSHSAILRKK
jgi:SAM-dependent methyltransferase